MNDGVTAYETELYEDELSIGLPSSLVSFYKQCNGLVGPQGELYVMPIQKLAAVNIELWLSQQYEDSCMPLECLLFFGSRADESLFAFPILGDTARGDRIYRWDRTTDSRVLIATSFEQYLYKRWKCCREKDERLFDGGRDCKDFDDYRTFLRWCYEHGQPLP